MSSRASSMSPRWTSSSCDRISLEVRKSLRRILAHRPSHHGRQCRRDGRVQLIEGRGLFRPELLEEMHRILAGERRAHAQELVENRADGEDIRPMVDPSAHLLRRHVAEATHDQPGSCEAALGIRHLGDAEIEDLHLTATQEEDVAGLDVPMDDPMLVGVVEAVAHLEHDGDLVLECQSSSLSDEVLQLFTLKKLHDDEELPIVSPIP